MYQILTIIQVLFGLGIIGLVLMQQGKGADAGAAFGSGSSGTVFGAQGSASFLSRATAIFAIIFFSSSLGLAVLNGHKEKALDLMDIPEIEEPMADVPALDSSTGGPSASVPSISQQQTGEEIPVTSESAGEAIPNAEEAPEAIETETAEIIIEQSEQGQQPASTEQQAPNGK